MENLNEEGMITEEIQASIEEKVKELRNADPKVGRIYPIVVYGDKEAGEKALYIAYFKQPSFPAFSKYLALAQKDVVGAMRDMAKECFLDGDKELVKNDSLFCYGLMPHLSQLIEVRQGKIVNLSKAGK